MSNIDFILLDINNNLSRIADALEESNLAGIADALKESNKLVKDLGGNYDN